MSSKPLYENVGIGTIIRRIGECTALTNDYNIDVRLTQQTPREDECKDLCISVGSKVVVIDFKAPDQISSSERIYNNVTTRIGNLRDILTSDNLLLGLIHAALMVDPSSQRRSSRGYFLHIATPITTVFIPLSRFPHARQKSSGIVNLGTLRVRGVKHSCPFRYYERIRNIIVSEEELIRNAIIPSCHKYCDLFTCNNRLLCGLIRLMRESERESDVLLKLLQRFCCSERFDCGLSCGGLCYVDLGMPCQWVQGYTLASLLWMMRCCRIGYYVKDSAERDKLLEFLYKKSEGNGSKYVYILVYTPKIGFQMISLNFLTYLI